MVVLRQFGPASCTPLLLGLQYPGDGPPGQFLPLHTATAILTPLADFFRVRLAICPEDCGCLAAFGSTASVSLSATFPLRVGLAAKHLHRPIGKHPFAGGASPCKRFWRPKRLQSGAVALLGAKATVTDRDLIAPRREGVAACFAIAGQVTCHRRSLAAPG